MACMTPMTWSHVKGDSDKRLEKAVAPRGLRGHAPPENF